MSDELKVGLLEDNELEVAASNLAVRIGSIRQAITVVVDAVTAPRSLLLVVRGDAGAVDVVALIARRSTAPVRDVQVAGGEAVVACRCTGPTVRARVGRAGVSIITI